MSIMQEALDRVFVQPGRASRVKTIDEFQEARKILGVDVRVDPSGEETIQGIQGPNEERQSCMYVFYKDGIPVFNMHFLVFQGWQLQMNTRMFKLDPKGVVMTDLAQVTDDQIVWGITSGWANAIGNGKEGIVDNRPHVVSILKSAGGINFFKKIAQCIQENAPEGSYFFASAQGEVPSRVFPEWKERLSQVKLGEFMSWSELNQRIGLPENTMGPHNFARPYKAADGVSSLFTAHLCKRLGVEEMTGYCTPLSFGPVLAKKLK